MGSESQRKIGMSRGVDTTRTNPSNLFIVGLDGEGETEQQRIDWLKGLFPSMSDQIDAERDTRACRELTEQWIAEFNPADADPIKYVNLGVSFPADGCGRWSGKPLLLVNDGRQRTKTFRALNERLVSDGAEPLKILCIQRRFKTTLAAREAKARGNVRVEMTPMERAWLAQEFVDAGKPMEKIAPLVGVGTEQAVRDLLSLLDCSSKVQAAVDAGVVTQTEAKKLSKKDHAEQDAELDRRVKAADGKQGRERTKALRGEADGQSPVKPSQIKKVVAEVERIDRSQMVDPHRVDEWLALLRWALGDPSGFDALPDEFKSAVLQAKKRKGEETSKDVPPESGEREAA